MVSQLLAPPGPSATSSASSSWRGSSHIAARRSLRQEDLLALPAGAEQRFHLLEEVGQGTYGLVHRAIDLPTGRQVTRSCYSIVLLIGHYFGHIEDKWLCF